MRSRPSAPGPPADGVPGRRLFIAVDPPADTRRRAAAVGDRLRAAGVRARWVDPAALHLTLHFLGDAVPAERLPDLCAAIDAAAATCPPIDVAFGGVGTFPQRGPPRVLWLGVTRGAAELMRLHAAVAERLAALGVAVERRPFEPHLTLGRLPPAPGRRGGSAVPAGVFDALAAATAGAGRIDRVSLFSSRLDPAGAIHERLHDAALVGTAAAEAGR